MIRLLLSPKWMVWHVLTLGAMVTCAWLAVWQWERAGSAMGSALNIGYGLQWPVFAVFFGVMWFRFLRMEINGERTDGAAGGSADGAPTDGRTAPAATEPGPATTTTTTAGTANPTTTGERTDPGAGGRTDPGTDGRHDPPADEPARTAEQTAPEPTVPPQPARRSPFTPRPAGVTPPRSTDPQLRAYNEELARLAARQEESTT